MALEQFLSQPRSQWLLPNLEVAYTNAVHDLIGWGGDLPKWLEEGLDILRTWWDRQDWDDWDTREIISLEQREKFFLDTSIGKIPFIYVIDRLDRLEDGELEVVDYKSGFFQVRANELRNDVQARSYALAVWLANDKPPRVWVMFDYLRNDIPSTSVAFTAKDCEEYLEFLHALAEEVIASDGQKETPGGLCRFCPRALECESLYKLGITDLHGLNIEQLATLKVEVAGALGALEASKRRIDTSLRAALEESENPALELPSGTQLTLGLGRRERIVNWGRVSELLNIPPIPAKVSPVEFEAFLKSIKDESVYSDDIINELHNCIDEQRGTPQIRVVKPPSFS